MQKNLTLAYVYLVGMPLLVLTFVLRAGSDLNPPVSIAGPWTMQFDAEASRRCGCSGMRIAQSGTLLVMTLDDRNKTALTGTIERGQFTAADDRGTIRVEASVSGRATGRSLDGRLVFESCASCAPASFHAVRQGLAGKDS